LAADLLVIPGQGTQAMSTRPLARRAGLVLAAVLATVAGTVMGEEMDRATRESVTIDFYFENDAFSGGKDKDYTGGLALSFTGAAAASHPFSIDGARAWIDRRTGLERDRAVDIEVKSFEVGMLAFTPADIELQRPVADDRPYASLVYVSNGRQVIDFAARTSRITGLSVGILGLSEVGRLQNGIHELTASSRANGWDHQVSNGGEPTARFSVSWQRYADTGSGNLQATSMAGVSVGYVTEATVGASVRFGDLRTPWWSFNVHHGNYGEKTHIGVPTSRSVREVFGLAGANLKLRAYNVFLQGQFRDSPVRYSASDIEPFVYEAWVGAGCELESGIRVAYLMRRHSSELKRGAANRAFTYGELIASYKF
jgi:hypothetical protein